MLQKNISKISKFTSLTIVLSFRSNTHSSHFSTVFVNIDCVHVKSDGSVELTTKRSHALNLLLSSPFECVGIAQLVHGSL